MTVARGLVGRDERGSGTIRILQLEDSHLDAELEHDALAEGGIDCEIERVQKRSEFAAALRKGGFDLILADYVLPGFDGLSALEMARGVCPEVPFILISGTLGEEAAIEALKRGATDYVLKHRLERLAPAVRRAVGESEERRERERAEQALRRSEAEYRAMFELAGVGKAQVDPHTGRFLRVNPKLCEITGYSAEEMLRLTSRGITHPEDREADAGGLRSMISGESSEYSAEQRYVRKDGTTIWVEVNTTLLRDEAGRPSRTVATIQDITHRKGTEEELVRLASFPDLNPDSIFETTVAGELTYLNAAARERFPDLSALGLRHPLLEGLQTVEREVLGGVRPLVREIQVDGSAYRQLIISVPERELLRFYTADTTEQHRAREALRRSEERFRSLVRYASDIIVILDAKGTIVYESPAVERVLGFRAEERMGSAAFDFVHPDDAGSVRGKLAELLEEPGRRSSAEYRVRDKAGAWHDFEAIGVNLLDDPVIRGVVVNARDITERRRAGEALRESEERFRLLAEKTNDLICLHETDGRYVYVSSSSKRLLGYEPDELLGADPYALFHPDDARRIRSGARDRVSQGRGASITYRIRKKNGEYTWFETLTEPILDDEGNVVRLQTSSRDVSDRRQTEEALRQSEQLYRSVVEQSVENIFIVDPE
ncbi:MAG TPA: PAS domain S-box protein, partial [Rubrobacter sp.]|nr:PAS domain S-box protein [Rubrobacter sp.]